MKIASNFPTSSTTINPTDDIIQWLLSRKATFNVTHLSLCCYLVVFCYVGEGFASRVFMAKFFCTKREWLVLKLNLGHTNWLLVGVLLTTSFPGVKFFAAWMNILAWLIYVYQFARRVWNWQKNKKGLNHDDFSLRAQSGEVKPDPVVRKSAHIRQGSHQPTWFSISLSPDEDVVIH